MINNILKYVLYPVSLVYAGVLYFRNMFFDIGIFRTHKLPAAILSVGNLTTGGTGKTPAVVYIAGKLQSSGYKVGILSRGYKRSSRGYVVVSDGERILADSRQGGDEPVMLAHSLPGVVVAVHEKRYRGGAFMIEDFGVDVIVLDDGFQHRTLHRDLDIVLINASRPDHLRAHVPAGRLRERKQSLRRADIVIVTKYDDQNEFRFIERLVHRYTAIPVTGSGLEPEVCVDVVRNIEIKIKDVVTKKAYLFSGIAEPEGFRKTVDKAGFSVCGVRTFPDHSYFNERIVQSILDEGRNAGAEMLLTTGKDAIRLHPYKHLFKESLPLFVLKVSFTMTRDDNDVLEKFLYRMIDNHKRSVTIK